MATKQVKTSTKAVFGEVAQFTDNLYFSNPSLPRGIALAVHETESGGSGGFSVRLLADHRMVAAKHNVSWKEATKFVRGFLTAMSFDEIARSYARLHGVFSKAEILGRLCDPDWEKEIAKREAA